MSVRRSLATLLVAASTLVGLVTLAPTASAAPAPGTAAAALDKLRVAPEVRTGYLRELFPHWVDADRDCRHTRVEVLEQETKVTPRYSSTSPCAITSGRWYSYYEGATHTSPAALHIDHVVALAEAWDSGARDWGEGRRRAFANDLGYRFSLEATTARVNLSKGDRDPSQWLPPRAVARCTYAVRWVAVKWRWSLTIDPAEKTALSRVLSGACGAGKLSLPAKVPFAPPPTSPTPTNPKPPNPGNAKNCSDFTTQAAAQSWFNTYYPHYGDVAGLDADGDRIACEALP